VTAQFTFLSGARVGQVETFRKAYIGLGRHPLSDVRFDVDRDLDVSSRTPGSCATARPSWCGTWAARTARSSTAPDLGRCRAGGR